MQEREEPVERRLHAASALFVVVLALLFTGYANATVNADFTAAPVSGKVPLSVQFTDNSTGSIASWLWQFGDAGYATTQNATHDYNTSNLYTVNLTVTGTDASTSTANRTIKVRPNASFTYSPASGPAPLTVQFHDTSQGSPTARYWEFLSAYDLGWSTNSTLQDPQVTFPYAGNYATSLNVTGGGGLTDEHWDYEIMVSPVARFTATPITGDGPLTVQFNDTSLGMWPTDPTSLLMTIFGNRYYWDFGDGSTSNDRNPVHVFHNTSTVTLTVAVMYMTNTSVPLQISVGASPNADFTASPLVGVAPLTVSFTDVSKGVSPLVYNWNFGDNTTTSTEPNPVHLFEKAGPYHVTLTVTDGDGKTRQKSRDIQATLTPGPVADFAASPRSGAAPLTVDFIDQSVGNGPLMYLWDFGDSSTLSDRYLKNPVHTYQAVNNYTVSLTVTDIDNRTGNKVATSFIRVGSVIPPGKPNASFTATPLSGFAPLTVQCTDTSTGYPTSWMWKVFWESYLQYPVIQSNLQSPGFTLTVPGNYTVVLEAGNALGSSNITRSNFIRVLNNPPHADFTASPTSGYVPMTVQFLDNSTGTGITSWSWDFGDGGTSAYQNPLYTYLSAGNHTVRLTVTNEGGSNTAIKTNYITTTGNTPTGESIAVYPGWNFVSVPKKLETGYNTASAVFSGVNTGQRSILTYNGSSSSWVNVDSGSLIEPLAGYWVYSTNQTVVPLHFSAIQAPVPSRHLYTGWNAIGFSGTTPVAAKNALTSLGSTWNYVLSYDGIAQRYDTPIIRGSSDPTFSDNRLMFPTDGYWIWMTSEGNLEGLV